MKNLLLFLVFACTFSFSCLGSPVPFSPIVRNYSVLDYNAGNENWAVAQDERGVMYFWQQQWTAPVRRKPMEAVSTADFGYCACGLCGFPTGGSMSDRSKSSVIFEQNDLNLLEYHSLKEQVKGFDFHNDEIWTIVEQGGNIIFQSFGSYFIYDGKGTKGVRCSELPLNLFPDRGHPVFPTDQWRRLYFCR